MLLDIWGQSYKLDEPHDPYDDAEAHRCRDCGSYGPCDCNDDPTPCCDECRENSAREIEASR